MTEEYEQPDALLFLGPSEAAKRLSLSLAKFI